MVNQLVTKRCFPDKKFHPVEPFADQVLEQSHGDYDDAVTRAFQAAYNRAPRQSEMALAKEAIAADADPKEGLRLFLQAMLGANDFLYSY